jgi:hypothetical protein
MKRPALFIAGPLVLAACGPVQSSSLLVDAQAELAAARTAEAEKQAPFEYTAAEEYLHKAREEQSYADYEVSIDFARKARDCARLARQISEAKMRTAVGATGASTAGAPRCRPGPERSVAMLDPSEEPAAKDPRAGQKNAKDKAKVVADEAKKKATIKSDPNEPKDPKAPKTTPKKVVAPKDESLPEGDE